MSDTSEMPIIQIYLDGKQVRIQFNSNNIAALLYGLKMAEMEIENQIIKLQQPKSPSIVPVSAVPKTLLDRLA